MFISRDLEPVIKKGATQVPVVAIIGPRQSGKSTLARHLFPKHTYLDLQDAELFEFAQNDPKGFLNTYKNEHGIIIDEAQYAPKLFPQIKVEADKNPQPGYYVLSGSQNFLLHEKISESLAGRVYFYKLLPFSLHELEQAHLSQKNPSDQITKGFYPRVYQPHIEYQSYYANYIATYVERDVRLIKNIDNIIAFKKCMQLCALRVGTMVNYTDFAAHCGVQVATIKSWFSLLEASFIIWLIPSYHNNLGKRITKSPKLYFYDVGLAVALMNIDPEILSDKRDIYGALFENMIIMDIVKNLETTNTHYNLTFYRNTNQQEIDLIVEYKGKVVPLEIKAAETLSPKFFTTLTWFKEQENRVEHTYLVYTGTTNQVRSSSIKVVSWNDLYKLF